MLRATGEMRWSEGWMMWTRWRPNRRRPTATMREWREGVEVDLQWGQIAKVWGPCQELSCLEGCHPISPGARSMGCVGQLKFSVTWS